MNKLNIFITLLFVSLSFQSFSQDFWRPLNGPKGAVINQIAINNQDQIFISLEQNEVWRSTDKGLNWEPFSYGLPKGGIHSKLIATKDGSIISLFRNYEYDNVKKIFQLKPQDNIWQEIIFPETLHNISEVQINPSGEIYLIESNKIRRSIDDGYSFQLILKTMEYSFNIKQVVLAGNDKNYLLANSNDSTLVYKFNDDGGDLVILSLPDEAIKSIAYDDKNGKILLASSENLYYSTNEGNSWNTTQKNPELNHMGIKNITVSPTGIIYCTASQKVFCSTDGGLSIFTLDAANDFFQNSLTDIAFISSGEVILLSSDPYNCPTEISCGISQDNGLSWSNFEILSKSPPFRNLIQTTSKEMYAISCESILKSTDDWSTWEELNINQESYHISQLISNKQGDLFTRIYFSDILKSSDKGISWDNLTPYPDSSSGCHHIAINPEGDLIAISRFKDNWYSSDTGNTWNYFPRVPMFKYIESELFFHRNGDIFHNDNCAFSPSRSNDQGETWTHLDEKIFAFEIYDFHISELGVIYYSGRGFESIQNNGLKSFRVSYDAGDSFREIEYPSRLGSKEVSFITTSKQGDIIIIVGREIFISKNSGKDWTKIITGLPYLCSPKQIYIDADNYLYAVLSNDVIHKSLEPLSKRDTETGETYIKETANVNQVVNGPKTLVYPNPFSNSTTFEIQNSHFDNFNFELYSPYGRMVEDREVLGNLFYFEKQNLSSGIYFYKILHDNQEVSSGKVVIQ